MKEVQFSKKEFFIISLMLFSMFFGAGNFIFPPMVAKDSGEFFYFTILYFCLTAVALPVLGVAAVAKAGTLKELASRVHPIFASIFVIIIYVSIGPLLAIPRASIMPYEIAIIPFVDEKYNSYVTLIYSAIYYALNYYICLNPSKMVETLGKYLTPILLLLILTMFITAYFSADLQIAKAQGKYLNHPISSAFIDGYQTMDALAALVFGISVVAALKGYGVKNKSALSILTVKTGLCAGVILMIVYVFLGYLGYKFGFMFNDATNGARLLSSISNYLFGKAGIVILGLACFLACFTTTIGLIGSTGVYFESISKIKYKYWILLWCLAGFLVANLGLTQILKFSVPILVAIYPVAIILTILSFLNTIIDESKIVYCFCIYTAAFIGIVNALEMNQIIIPFVTEYIIKLPFYDDMLGWITPSATAFIISYLIHFIYRDKA